MEFLDRVWNYFDGIPSFFGSLIGAFISGSVAVAILAYNTYQKNKEYNFKCYGAMKIIMTQLIALKEYKLYMTRVAILVKKAPDKKMELAETLNFVKIMIEKTNDLLAKERGNIPYDFISRYYTITTGINFVLFGIERYISDPNEGYFDALSSQMNDTVEMADRFVENTIKYLNKVEKKYKLQDFY